MKTKSVVRRGSSRPMLWGMLGVLATLMLIVGLMFGMGTSTSAKAAETTDWGTASTIGCTVDVRQKNSLILLGTVTLSGTQQSRKVDGRNKYRWSISADLSSFISQGCSGFAFESARLSELSSLYMAECYYENGSYIFKTNASYWEQGSMSFTSAQGILTGGYISCEAGNATTSWSQEENISVAIPLKEGDTTITTLTFNGIQQSRLEAGRGKYRWTVSCDLSAYASQGYMDFLFVSSNMDSYVNNHKGAYAYTNTQYIFKTSDSYWSQGSVRFDSVRSILENGYISCFHRVEVALPEAPTKEGYHFVGWYYDEAFTQPYTGGPVYNDTNLYAKMAINTYSVKYETNGGASISAVTVEWNTSAPMPTPKRTGYTFVGWFTETGSEYTGAGVKENIVLVAHWELQIFTVTFYLDGEVYTTVQVPYGSTLSTAMKQAKVASYQPLDSSGKRVSRYASTITDDTNVLVRELHGWEKYGDFVGRSPWYTWLWVGLGGALAVAFSICVVLLVKWRK